MVRIISIALRPALSSCSAIPRIREARIITEKWRREFNAIRPHSSLGYRPPAPETFQLADPACAVSWLQPDRPSAGAHLSVTWNPAAHSGSGQCGAVSFSLLVVNLFLVFAGAFLLLAVHQALTTLLGPPAEERSWLYLLRLAAFIAIIAAVVGKNFQK